MWAVAVGWGCGGVALHFLASFWRLEALLKVIENLEAIKSAHITLIWSFIYTQGAKSFACGEQER